VNVPRLYRRLRPAVGLIAVVATALAVLANPAAADPLADASAQASQLQAQVSSLQTSAEQASEKYDGAESALAQLVVQQRQAEQSAAAAQSTADDDLDVLQSRARALYMAGGRIGIYASLLGGIDPSRLFAGLHDVQTVSDADSRALSAVGSSAKGATTAQNQVTALLATQSDLTSAANDAANQVQLTLAQQQQALDGANSHVRDLEAQLQAQLDAQSAARAAQALALAQQTAFASGEVMGAASPTALSAIAWAKTEIGKPYVFGGSGPDTWDCSGLTQWAFRQAGIGLPRTAAAQYAAVPLKIPLGQLQAGDLLFWATDTADPSTIHHVAIYLGGGLMLAAPHTGTVVQVQPVYLDGYIGAVRVA
jgi:peptidoglycan DL-endopeptidase CwlO